MRCVITHDINNNNNNNKITGEKKNRFKGIEENKVEIKKC